MHTNSILIIYKCTNNVILIRYTQHWM